MRLLSRDRPRSTELPGAEGPCVVSFYPDHVVKQLGPSLRRATELTGAALAAMEADKTRMDQVAIDRIAELNSILWNLRWELNIFSLVEHDPVMGTGAPSGNEGSASDG